ncbi:MAG: DUF58 domain-containing protein [Acidimicrobiales bacterium]
MTHHLTYRFWLYAVIGFASLVLALVTRSVEPAALGAPFLTVLALSVADGWWPRVTARYPELSAVRVVEGDEVIFAVELVPGRRASWVELEIQFAPILVPAGPTRFVTRLDGPRCFTVPLDAVRWGSAGPEWVIVTTRDRFGVSERIVRHPLHLPVRIHPPSEYLRTLVPLTRDRPVTGEHRSRRVGPGAELAEVRPYRFGDPVRMIHPRLSSRRGSPMVIERHPDHSSDVVLVVDSAQDLGVDLETTLRWTVTAATAIADQHLGAQDRVGLLDVGRGVRWFPARLGRRQLHVIVDALLATEILPNRRRDDVFVLPLDLPATATVVAISPLLSEVILSALVDLRNRGHEVIVIKPALPDPGTEVSVLAQRIFRVGNELNERWLLERGAVVIPWSAGDSLEQILRRAARMPARRRHGLLPTGGRRLPT